MYDKTHYNKKKNFFLMLKKKKQRSELQETLLEKHNYPENNGLKSLKHQKGDGVDSVLSKCIF